MRLLVKLKLLFQKLVAAENDSPPYPMTYSEWEDVEQLYLERKKEV